MISAIILIIGTKTGLRALIIPPIKESICATISTTEIMLSSTSSCVSATRILTKSKIGDKIVSIPFNKC